MSTLLEKLNNALKVIESNYSGAKPVVGIILGSGLGGIAKELDASPKPVVIPYSQIPNFVTSTVVGHAGNLLLGNINGVPTVCMQGRFHVYEGYSMDAITFPVRVMAKLGVKILVVSNAAGFYFD
jgi:purine-nucleoside phosphorylase